jgi:hypothetical protein
LKDQLDKAQKEILELRNSHREVLSPIPQEKTREEDLTINLTPISRNNYQRSKNSPPDTIINRSSDLSFRIKSRRAGAAIGNLVSKLKSTKKTISDY